MSNVDGYVINETYQGAKERVEYVVKGFRVYRNGGKDNSLTCIGFVEDGIAYEYRGEGKLPRSLGRVTDLE